MARVRLVWLESLLGPQLFPWPAGWGFRALFENLSGHKGRNLDYGMAHAYGSCPAARDCAAWPWPCMLLARPGHRRWPVVSALRAMRCPATGVCTVWLALGKVRRQVLLPSPRLGECRARGARAEMPCVFR